MSRAAATALLAAVLGLSALLFALPSLYVPAVALGLLAPAAAAWVALSVRAARVELAATPLRVEEGESLDAAATARLGHLSAPGELVAAGLHHRSTVAPGEEAALRGEPRFSRRGRHSIAPARLTLEDPLGLARRTVSSAPLDVLALPRVEPVRALGRGALDRSGATAGRAAGPELELDSLRPLRSGTPATRIHWPTVARTGEIVERRLLPDSGTQPLVVLDVTAPPAEEALDRAVRAAASLCRSLALVGGCRVLLPGDGRTTRIGPDLAAWPAVHERLALVETARVPHRLPRLAAASTLFWVMAATRQPPRGLLHAPAAERFLVAPGRASGASAFTVAGCVGVRLGRSSRRAA